MPALARARIRAFAPGSTMKLAVARIHCALLVGLLTIAPAAWSGPLFYASFTSDGSDCTAIVAPLTPFFTYIMVQPGTTMPGISGAEFRIDNFDPAWFNTVTPNPAANLALGNPITGGCNIAFPTCQLPGPGGVLLYTIQSLALAPVSPRQLPIARHTNPSSPNFQCPLTTLCNAPVFTKECGTGMPSCINWTGACWCEFAVQPATWSRVKQLYTAR